MHFRQPLPALLILLTLPALALAWTRHGTTASARSALPDPRLTPGALNRSVSQSDIYRTICVRGWTRRVRPPERYTERLKRRQIREYGYRDRWLRDYEEDHLIPLELGGSPASPANLWPEPHRVRGGWGSYAKDRLENRLNHLVCRGRLPLASARRIIASDWVAAYRRYLGPVPDNRRPRSRWSR